MSFYINVLTFIYYFKLCRFIVYMLKDIILCYLDTL